VGASSSRFVTKVSSGVSIIALYSTLNRLAPLVSDSVGVDDHYDLE